MVRLLSYGQDSAVLVSYGQDSAVLVIFVFLGDFKSDSRLEAPKPSPLQKSIASTYPSQALQAAS